MVKRKGEFVEVRGIPIWQKRQINAVNRLVSEGIVRSRRDIIGIKLHPATARKLPSFYALIKKRKQR